MLGLVKKIIQDVLTSLYQPFGFSVLFAVFFMVVILYAKEHGWKHTVSEWIKNFKTKKWFRRTFLLIFYTMMILFKTLLNRNMWVNPVNNILGTWSLYKVDTNTGDLVFTTEIPENLALFIPFTILFIWTFRERLFGNKVTLFNTCKVSLIIVFLFSLSIESLQLFLRLGTWQLSDLFFNTLGGLIGGVIYWIGYKIRSIG